ncbi:MAG TPA: PAC2 family protein [Ornithinimicrobium sp.]|uniref:PAC2 family protein n=1 Tax=Ornithinimicrobium sp. TaxID=1977084 RepID=UPI002B4643A8|nr:PAC2 family protein [Ornithinimicrobium sp.]HKJ10991.1 PAC2 family protein [Ornithinimicrobium sp.]
MDHSPLFRLEPDTQVQPLHAPLLHVAIDGFIDAGHVRAQMTRHILDTLEHRVVASFDMDELIDYRSRRPTMTFDTDHWADYDEPSLVLYRVLDTAGQPFLLLHGDEPDLRWEAFARAVHQICLAFGVRTVVSAHGIPMAVPHTRPVGMTRFASDQDLIDGNVPMFGQVKVPASAESLLHLRLGQEGLSTMGLAVHVPHYLAESSFGDAAVAAMDAYLGLTELQMPTADLVAAAGVNRAEITEQVGAAPEVGEAVAELEKRYDQFLEGQRQRHVLAQQEAELPSADEIGAEFEEFLRESSAEDPPTA